MKVAEEILNDFIKIPIDIYEHKELLESAWQIATKHQVTIYDSLYLALACIENCSFITADRAFFNALKSSNLATAITWIEDIGFNAGHKL